MSIIAGQVNPSSLPLKGAEQRTRIPMSVPRQKLAVPDIPGYHLHWMLGTPERLDQAKKAGYVPVEADEVDVTNTSLADGDASSGSTDMGSQVSIVAGGDTDRQGQSVRLILMKIKQEWWDEDQKLLEKKSDDLVTTLRSGAINAAQAGETQADARLRYVDRNRTSTMFQKRRP